MMISETVKVGATRRLTMWSLASGDGVIWLSQCIGIIDPGLTSE